MAEGPAVHKRIDAAAPPTDLPDTPLSYPGKPLAHRYLPAEKPRKREEDASSDLPKLASDATFSPIASVRDGDRNIHLGSVANTRQRHVTPVALGGSVNVPTAPGDRVEIDDDIHKPLSARLQQTTTRSKAPVKLAESTATDLPEAQEAEETGQPTTGHDQNFLTEIERLKEQARRELAERGVQPTPPTPEPSDQEPVAKPSGTEEQGTPIQEDAQPAEGDEDTERLLQQAEQLEKELTRLREGIAHKEEEKQQRRQLEASKAETYEAQISQLTADRTSLANKVNDLTAAHSEELQKRRELEQQLRQVIQDYEVKIKTAETEKAQLTQTQEEQKGKIETLQQRLGQMEQEFQSKLEHIEKEKNSLLGELEKLKEPPQSSEQKEDLEKELHELRSLRNQFDNLSEERTKLKEENAQLQKLIEELRESDKGLNEKLPQKEIESAEKKKEPEKRPPDLSPATPSRQDQESHVRVVKPQAAVGRMAPSLTTSPNVINGIVKDAKGMLLSNVIIVVKDAGGQPVRALKTNKIGQFAISTPLPNGTYTMELEAEGKSFDVIQVDVEGKVMPPIEIRAN